MVHVREYDLGFSIQKIVPTCGGSFRTITARRIRVPVCALAGGGHAWKRFSRTISSFDGQQRTCAHNNDNNNTHLRASIRRVYVIRIIPYGVRARRV